MVICDYIIALSLAFFVLTFVYADFVTNLSFSFVCVLFFNSINLNLSLHLIFHGIELEKT